MNVVFLTNRDLTLKRFENTPQVHSTEKDRDEKETKKEKAG